MTTDLQGELNGCEPSRTPIPCTPKAEATGSNPVGCASFLRLLPGKTSLKTQQQARTDRDPHPTCVHRLIRPLTPPEPVSGCFPAIGEHRSAAILRRADLQSRAVIYVAWRGRIGSMPDAVMWRDTGMSASQEPTTSGLFDRATPSGTCRVWSRCRRSVSFARTGGPCLG